MYQRFRLASLRIRSCMTSFLKRLSKLSWDSPSLKVTVANRLTSFLPDKSAGKEKTRRALRLAGNRVSQDLA